MKDQQLRNPMLWIMVKQEHRRQIEKWGIQDREPFEWLAYTTEELGELAKAISEHHYRGGLPSEVVKEAIQTATLCLKIAEMYLHAGIETKCKNKADEKCQVNTRPECKNYCCIHCKRGQEMTCSLVCPRAYEIMMPDLK